MRSLWPIHTMLPPIPPSILRAKRLPSLVFLLLEHKSTQGGTSSVPGSWLQTSFSSKGRTPGLPPGTLPVRQGDLGERDVLERASGRGRATHHSVGNVISYRSFTNQSDCILHGAFWTVLDAIRSSGTSVETPVTTRNRLINKKG